MKKIIILVAVLLFVGCSEDKKSSITKVDSVKEIASEHEQVKEKSKTQEVVEEEVEVVHVTPDNETKEEVSQKSGESIFKACSACHGEDGSKVALGKSLVIKGWDSARLENALHGYKNGTYGREMKGLMKGQMTNLSDDDIKLVSEYISKL